MILLQHLHVRALKQLCDVDLWFPRRGSVLIEGSNESGKSTLFEAIYFALYGSPLIGEEARATLEDLLPHSGTPAQVDLTLTTQEATLEIRRRLFPASSARRVTHEARLRVRRDGRPLEELNGPSAVNARILQELNGLDGEALRNSCFMEQKGLDRVERLSRDQRETAVARLIGIERLRRIEKELHEAGETEKRALVRLREEYEIAQLRQSAIEAETRAQAAEAQMRAAWVRLRLEERDSRNLEIAAQREQLAALIAERERLTGQLAALAQVQTFQAALDEADAHLTEAAAAQHAQAEAAAQLAELARIEREMLPPAIERLAALGALETQLRTVEELRPAIILLEELIAAESAQTDARTALAATEHAYASAHEAAARATLHSTLTRWLHVRELQALTAGDANAGAEQAKLAARRATLEGQLSAAEGAAGRWQRFALIAALLAVLALIVGLKFAPPLVLVTLFASGMGGFCLWNAARQRQHARNAGQERAGVALQLAALQAKIETAQRMTGSLTDVPQIEQQLHAAGLDISSVEAARAALATLSADDGDALALQQREREAQQAVMQQQAYLATAETRLQRARQTLQAAGADDATFHDARQRVTALQEALRQREAAIETISAELAVTPERGAVAAARGAAEAEQRALAERLDTRPDVQVQAQGWAERERRALANAGAILHDLQHQMALDSPDGDDFRSLPDDGVRVRARREQVAQFLAERRNDTDERQAYAELATVDERMRALAQQEESDAAIYARLHGQIADLLAGANISYSGAESFAALASQWPTLAQVDSAQIDAYQKAYQDASQEAHHLIQSAEERAQNCGLGEAELDIAACAERLAESERAYRRYLLAEEMAQQVRARIVRRILPETQAHMRALLPELTAGRYRDVQLLAEDATNQNADLKIRLWDEVAGRLVGKDIFSGGTRDQCSLALRLAFALATLPKELGAMPGFIFLDEPLSSFDAERSQALVRILTQGTIAQQFDQVLLISHSQSFNPESFRYFVRMENGSIAESNLPLARTAEELWQTEDATAVSLELAGG